MKYFLLIILMLLGCIACVKTPTVTNDYVDIEVMPGDCLILCEGLMGYDNSEITYINTASGLTIIDAYSQSNPGFRLGDTANDIIVENDTIYISSTIGDYIEVISLKDLKTIKRIALPENSGPRKLALDNDYIYCSLLFESQLAIINRFTLELSYHMIETGPQPEGVIVIPNKKLIAANSAYGDFNASHPDAGTLSVIDINTKTELRKIEIGPNVCEVVYNYANNMIYAAYYNLPSMTDSLGGIVEISPSDFSIKRHWNCNPFRMAISLNGDSLYFIDQKRADKNQSGAAVSYVALHNGEYGNMQIFPGNDILYSLSVSPIDGSVWVGNAKNHQSNGEIYRLSGSKIVRNIGVGLNPNRIVFVN